MLRSPAQAQPTIISTLPDNFSTGVSPSAPVVFTFSTAMDESATTVEFLANWGTPVTTTAAWSADGTQLTCTPTATFPTNTLIIWSVDGQDLAGNALDSLSGAGMFTTGNGPAPISTFAVAMESFYEQAGSAPPTPAPTAPYGLATSVTLAPGRAATSVSLTLPPGPVINLRNNPTEPGVFNAGTSYADLTAFQAACPSGNYIFEVVAPASDQQVTVNLSAALPQPDPPHVSNSSAAQTMDPRQPFTLRWDASTALSANNFILLVIANPTTGQAAFSNAYPGSATAAVLPAHALKAGTSYSAELSFNNLASATNATDATVASRATLTRFTFDTQSVPADLVSYGVVRGPETTMAVFQGSFVSAEGSGACETWAQGVAPTSILDGSVRTPAGDTRILTVASGLARDFMDGLDLGRAESDYPQGAYSLNLNTANNGPVSLDLSLPAPDYLPVPQIVNLDDFLAVDTNKEQRVVWNPLPNPATNQIVRLSVCTMDGLELWATPRPGQPGALPATTTNAVIPASAWWTNTEPLNMYQVYLTFYNLTTVDTTSVPGAIGFSGFASTLEVLALTQTNSPPPPPPPPVTDEFAPDSLAGSVLTLTATNGAAPFITAGFYQLVASILGNSYLTLGPATPLSSGSYTYSKTGPALGGAALADAASGEPISLQLVFDSPTSGAMSLTNSAGFQVGFFSLAHYADATPPDLVLPSLAQGHFQTYLSGQGGFVYSIESSSNLTDWVPWQSVLLQNLMAPLADSAGSPARFFRARLSSSDFAPLALSGKTFNLAIHEGAGALPADGICQWRAGADGSSYQLLAGPGTLGGSGAYTYTNTGGNAALLTYANTAGGGQATAQLVFTAPDSGYFYLTNPAASGYEMGAFTLADGAVPFLGNLKFTPNGMRAGTLLFSADGSSASLSVTNATGWIWTLDLPGDALNQEQTITMTPFATTDPSQSLLPISNGVMLEPAGLRFADRVKLTVTPPQPLGPHAMLLIAGAGDLNLSPVDTTPQSGTLSTTLLQCQPCGVSDPSDAQLAAFLNSPLTADAEAAFIQATNDIAALISAAATNLPPPPPDYTWDCSSSSGQPGQAVTKYVQTLLSKDNQAIDRLRSASGVLKLLGQAPQTSLPPCRFTSG